MPAKVKTNAMRLLDSRRIPYQAFEYSSDIKAAEEVAEIVGAPPDQVFKTLVVLRERGRPLLVMVPGSQEIDLRVLAQAVGEKKLHMAAQKEAEHLTGLQVGGISALCLLNRGFDIYADESIVNHVGVYVSAGNRGLNVFLGPHDLLKVTGARLVPTQPSS